MTSDSADDPAISGQFLGRVVYTARQGQELSLSTREQEHVGEEDRGGQAVGAGDMDRVVQHTELRRPINRMAYNWQERP